MKLRELLETIVTESTLSVDVPTEEWLQDKIDYAKKKGRNEYGVPYMGSTTASVRGTPPKVRVVRLHSLRGMRREQTNVRYNDLKWLMDYMDKNKKLPPMGSSPDSEYLPYIMVAYNGEAWVNEGNHRIMAAYRLGWDTMPIEIRYFDGGERVEDGPMYPGKIGLGNTPKVKEQDVSEAPAGYKEIEFVCVNPQFPDATDPALQKKMYRGLKQIDGVVPLWQEWGDYSEGQASLSAIYQDSDSRDKILSLAKQLGVEVDLEQAVSADYVDRARRGEHEGQQGVAEGLQNNGISFRVQKGKNKFVTTMTVNNEQVGVYQYDATTGRSIAEVYPEFKGKGFGKLLVLHAIYTAAKLGLDFQEDESRTAEYDNVLDSLSSNSYIVDDDGYWYVTGEGEQYLQQSLKQGVAEGSVQISEYRDRLLQYVKSLLPNYPEYVLKDWLVPNKGDFSNLPDTDLKNGIMEKLKLAGLTPNTKWQLVPDMKFTMDMFEPKTKQRLIGRAGGSSDLGMGIPRDKERHATQAALAQQQGGVRKEPVLLIKTDKGYELLEGWHRTIQHFAKYPNGYTGPAYVAVAQQGVAEARSNPEQNVKYESGMKELVAVANSIADTENWAISMTSEAKLGINPQVGISEDTPKGIYFYPLDYAVDFARRGKKLPWGHDYLYIQLFQYDRSGEMTKETSVDSNKLKQALLQYCPEDVIQQAIDEPEYDGTPYYFIYDCLSRLGKSDETNVVRWNKVLRDLGFTSVFDDGHGWIAHNEPTQGVVLDPRVIKQLKTISNKKQSKLITPAVIERAIFETMDMELAASRSWQAYDPDGSKLRAAAKEYAKKPEFKQWFGKQATEEIFDKAASWGRYGARQLSQEAWAWYKEQQAQQPVKQESLEEAPLADYEPLGDFTKPGPFTGADKKLIPHPANQLKAEQFFSKTPYDIRLFFSNLTGTGKYSEYGVMAPDVLKIIFGDDADKIINGHDDAITVVYVGNKGDSKKMLTPWVMAHRLGHAIQAGVRSKGLGRKDPDHPWARGEDHFFKAVNSMLEEHYGKRGTAGGDLKYELTPEYNALFNAMGTQRSSRSNEIRRPYEFLYEIFAQYLGTGKVTFNPLPANLAYGRKAWGNPTKYMNIKPEYKEETDRHQIADQLAYDMELMFNDVMSQMVGKILVM